MFQSTDFGTEMDKNIIVFGIVVLLLCIGLSGCEELGLGSNDSNGDDVPPNTIGVYDRFVGTWSFEFSNLWGNQSEIVIFFSNGKCKYDGADCYWELKDGKLTIALYDGSTYWAFDYYFSNNFTELHLKSVGADYYRTFTKQ